MARLAVTGHAIERSFAPGAGPEFRDRVGFRFAEHLNGEQAALLILAGLLLVLVVSTLRVRRSLERRRNAAPRTRRRRRAAPPRPAGTAPRLAALRRSRARRDAA